VNDCAIDLSKAFDEVNHRALYIKQMKKTSSSKSVKFDRKYVLVLSSSIKWYDI